MNDADAFRDTLAQRGRPHILLYSGDPTRLTEHIDALPRDVFNVWKIDGSRLTTEEGVFREFALKMRFPDYFGNNWNALDDCIGDLDWGDLEPVHQLVLIQDADNISSLGAEYVQILLLHIDNGVNWYEHENPTWAYKVIFQVDESGAEMLTEALRTESLEYAKLALDG